MTRDRTVARIVWALTQHAPIALVRVPLDRPLVLCACQPANAAPMSIDIWHRHVAEHAAEAAGQLQT